MELGNDDPGSCGPQAFCHRSEVFGAVIHAMNEHYGGQYARLLGAVSDE